MFGIKKGLAKTALKKLKPIHLFFMVIGIIMTALFGLMAFFPGFITSFL